MATSNDSRSDITVPAEVMHPGSRQLFCYWERIRGEASAAPRSAIDLKDITRIVPWLALLEPAPGNHSFLWRLAGTGICRLWGRELTGREVTENWRSNNRDCLMKALTGVVTAHQPFVARFVARSLDGDEVGIEVLALPVAKDGRREPQVLACLMPFREPAWSGESPLMSFALSSLRVIWTEPLPDAETRTLLPQGRPRGFLRVINGGLASE